MKKLLNFIFLLGLLIFIFLPINYLSHQNFDLIQRNFVSINFFDTRDFNNQPFYSYDNVLKQLFIQNLYTHFVIEELESFKSITAILVKKFVNFWFVSESIKIVVEKLVYLFKEIRKFFGIVYKLLFSFVISNFFLFYFKTHLKIHPTCCGMVLRC